jgi:hypothetical protein
MSFNRQGWNSISRSTTAPKPVLYTYDVNLITDTDDSDDALATIAASAFFNDVADDIDANDLVYVVGSDGTGLYRFTSANGVTPVTVTAFDTVPAGSIVNADISASAAIVPSKFTTAANYKVLCLPVSFATGAQATHTVYFPMAVTVTGVRSFVTGAIAASDNATITCSNNAGSAMANGVVTIDASAAVGVEDSASPTTNNTFTAGQKMQLACAKTTAGGTANVYIEYYTTG